MRDERRESTAISLSKKISFYFIFTVVPQMANVYSLAMSKNCNTVNGKVTATDRAEMISDATEWLKAEGFEVSAELIEQTIFENTGVVIKIRRP